VPTCPAVNPVTIAAGIRAGIKNPIAPMAEERAIVHPIPTGFR
jgi:hypothetical protein